MALQQARTFRGISIPAAYLRVDRIWGGKAENWTGMVGVYANQASAEAGDRALEEFQFSADYAAEQPNPLAAVYLAMKADEQFSTATDC